MTTSFPAFSRPLRYLESRDRLWWLWLIVAALLWYGVAGCMTARYAALAISAALMATQLWHSRSLTAFRSQVRVIYFLLMVVSFVPILTPLLWIQAAGTTALALAGYCPLARTLLFLPHNRSVPLTWERALRIVFHPPMAGSVRGALLP